MKGKWSREIFSPEVYVESVCIETESLNEIDQLINWIKHCMRFTF